MSKQITGRMCPNMVGFTCYNPLCRETCAGDPRLDQPNEDQKPRSQTTADAALRAAIRAAQSEWSMQAALPDNEPARMAEAQRDGYLTGRLVGCLHTIIAIAPHAPFMKEQT